MNEEVDKMLLRRNQKNSLSSDENEKEFKRKQEECRSPQNNPLRPIDIPLTVLLCFAIDKNQQDLSKQFDSYRGPAWEFICIIKAHPELQRLSSEQAANVIDDILCSLYPTSANPWKEALGDVDSLGQNCDPFAHFLNAWDCVDNPPDLFTLPFAVWLADHYSLNFPSHFMKKVWDSLRRFIATCAWLQGLHGDKNIFISCRAFAKVLNVDKVSISRYAKQGEAYGYLKKAREHQGRELAAEYQFDLHKLNCLMENISLDGGAARTAIK